MVDCLMVNAWRAHACMDAKETVGKNQWWESGLYTHHKHKFQSSLISFRFKTQH